MKGPSETPTEWLMEDAFGDDSLSLHEFGSRTFTKKVKVPNRMYQTVPDVYQTAGVNNWKTVGSKTAKRRSPKKGGTIRLPPTKKRGGALANDTDFWGFPIYFSPESDQHRRNAAADKRAKAAERKRVARERHEKQLLVEAAERIEAEKDYQKYIYFANKFGVLDGLTFGCSGMIGRTYERKILRTVNIIQRFVRKCAADFLARRSEVAARALWPRVLQEANLGYREHVRREAIVQKSLKRIQLAMEHSVFDKWCEHMRKMRLCKTLAKRIHNRDLHERMERWLTYSAIVNKERQDKLATFLGKMMRVWEDRCMGSWKLYTHRSLAIKRLRKAVLGHHHQDIFLGWKQAAAELREEREAATRLQAMQRAKKEKENYEEVKMQAILIQRAYREHGAKAKAARLQAKLDKLERETMTREGVQGKDQADEALKTKKAEYKKEKKAVQKEEIRLKEEQEAEDQAVKEAMEALEKGLKTTWGTSSEAKLRLSRVRKGLQEVRIPYTAYCTYSHTVLTNTLLQAQEEARQAAQKEVELYGTAQVRPRTNGACTTSGTHTRTQTHTHPHPHTHTHTHTMLCYAMH
jgi:hypothetical protein